MSKSSGGTKRYNLGAKRVDGATIPTKSRLRNSYQNLVFKSDVADSIHKNGVMSLNEAASRIIEKGIDDIILDKHDGMTKAIIISNTPKEIIEFAKNNGIDLGRSKIYMSPSGLKHAFRDNKHKEVSLSSILSLPKSIKDMSIYFENNPRKSPDKRNFILTDGRNKFIISRGDREIKAFGKKRKGMLFITAETLSPNEVFDSVSYIHIK